MPKLLTSFFLIGMPHNQILLCGTRDETGSDTMILYSIPYFFSEFGTRYRSCRICQILISISYTYQKSDFEYSDSDTIRILIKSSNSDMNYPYRVLTISGRMGIGNTCPIFIPTWHSLNAYDTNKGLRCQK